MKRLATSILLSFGLSPAFASAQDFAVFNQTQQHIIVLTGQPVATVNVPAAVAETTAVSTEWSKAEDLVNGSISKAKLTRMKEVTGALVNFTGIPVWAPPDTIPPGTANIIPIRTAPERN